MGAPHHVAFAVNGETRLHALYDTLAKHKVPIEFAPESVGGDSAKHLMCYEPSGVRVEFIWPGS